MARIQRFDFGALRDFRGPIVAEVLSEKEIEVVAPPPPPTYTEADLEAARLSSRKQGYAEGYASGEREAKQQFDAATAQANATIETLAASLSTLQHRYETMLQTESQQLSQLVSTIARKVAGDAMNARGDQEITAMIERCLPVILSRPKLSIELNPSIFEKSLQGIEHTLRDAGYEGEVQFKPNPALGASDVILDWISGTAKRSSAELWQEIDTLIDRIPLEITFQETLNTTT